MWTAVAATVPMVAREVQFDYGKAPRSEGT